MKLMIRKSLAAICTILFFSGAAELISAETPLSEKKAESEAARTLREKAEAGDAQSQVLFSIALRQGTLGISRDYVQAMEWAERAAEQGNAQGLFFFAMHYLSGKGIAQDVEKGLRLMKDALPGLKKLAEEGAPEAQCSLGIMYEKGLAVPQDYGMAVENYKKAAGKNHALAKNFLGLCFLKGNGLAHEPKEAVHWFQESAEQSCTEAQVNLAKCLLEGNGIEKDQDKALYWAQRAALRGDPNAQCLMGHILFNGLGTDKNPAEAVMWYKQSATQGDPEAQITLGHCLAAGTGIEKDLAAAASWYECAAKFGSSEGANSFADCLEKGQGIAKNDADAFMWYRKAAMSGNADGQFNLSRCYEDARGVSQDLIQAIKWNSSAARLGHLKAAARSALLEAKLASKRAEQLQKEHREKLAAFALKIATSPKNSAMFDRFQNESLALNDAALQQKCLLACHLGYFVTDELGKASSTKDELGKFSNSSVVAEAISRATTTCPNCKGKGTIDSKCPFCAGKGICPGCSGNGQYGDSKLGTYDCVSCKGSGKCSRCKGNGYETLACHLCLGRKSYITREKAEEECISILKELATQLKKDAQPNKEASP